MPFTHVAPGFDKHDKILAWLERPDKQEVRRGVRGVHNRAKSGGGGEWRRHHFRWMKPEEIDRPPPNRLARRDNHRRGAETGGKQSSPARETRVTVPRAVHPGG